MRAPTANDLASSARSPATEGLSPTSVWDIEPRGSGTGRWPWV
jgi:hypothetical protein